MEIDKKDWYCIKFDVPKDRNITAIEFSRKMNSFLEQIDEFNHSIVNGIDDTYTVTSYLEDFESGSVKWWILDKLNKANDQAIDKFVENPVKTIIAKILKISKKKVIECLSSKDFKQAPLEQQKIKILKPILEEVEARKEELNRNFLSPTINIDENRLFGSLARMSEISKELDQQVSFIYSYDNQNEQIVVPTDFTLNGSCSNSNILQPEEKTLQSTNIIEDIFTLLTPTSKEDCKWELDDNGSKIKCLMEDMEFFNKYRNNQAKLGGSEKLKVKMKVETFLESDKIKKEHTILKIIEIIPDRNLFNWQDES